jgi:predicted glutamine amidotransferase
MCELMGLSFAEPVSADFSIREFALRSQDNADGWGLAWYPDQSLAIIKEPLSWQTSDLTTFLESYSRLISRTYIGHVRHRTVGGPPTHADTHPFSRELGGREYAFAHNGTLNFVSRPHGGGRFAPIGGTDSERAFCSLLAQIEGAYPPKPWLDTESEWAWLHARLVELNDFGKLNCILSDGRRLFCYRDAAGHKGLCWRKVYLQHKRARRLEDNTIGVKLSSENANQGYVIATRPLTSHEWQDFAPSELAVFESGKLRYSSHRETARGNAKSKAACS